MWRITDPLKCCLLSELLFNLNYVQSILCLKAIKLRDEMMAANTANKEETNEETNGEETIARHRELLEERMDPDFGLLDIILAKGTLSHKEMLEVKDKSPFYRRNSQLLDFILKKHQGDHLIAGLRYSEQLHLVNYLNANGG